MSEKVLVAIITSASGIILAFVKWILPMISKYLENNPEENIEVNNKFKLIDHPIFSRISFMLSGVDYSLEFENKGRYLLVRDVIEKYLQSTYKELFKLAKTIDEYEKNGTVYDLHACHLRTLNLIIDEYTTVANYGNLDIKSLEVLTLFITKFQKWHRQRIDFLMERSAEINGSNFYIGNKVKAAALLDLYIGTISDTLHDGKNSLYALNGELSNKYYKKEFIE